MGTTQYSSKDDCCFFLPPLQSVVPSIQKQETTHIRGGKYRPAQKIGEHKFLRTSLAINTNTSVKNYSRLNLIWRRRHIQALQEILMLIGPETPASVTGHSFWATDFGELHQRTLCNVNKETERENERREGLSTAMWLCGGDLLTVGHNSRTTQKPQSSALGEFQELQWLFAKFGLKGSETSSRSQCGCSCVWVYAPV